MNTGPDTSLYMLPYNPNKREGVDGDSNVCKYIHLLRLTWIPRSGIRPSAIVQSNV